jgi:hypothetical protein
MTSSLSRVDDVHDMPSNAHHGQHQRAGQDAGYTVEHEGHQPLQRAADYRQWSDPVGRTLYPRMRAWYAVGEYASAYEEHCRRARDGQASHEPGRRREDSRAEGALHPGPICIAGSSAQG